MSDNNLELLENITKKAPWLIEGKDTYVPSAINENARLIIDEIRDYHLTIIADNGRVYKQYLTLKIEGDMMKIDKPFKWVDSTVSFHLFFRNTNNIWNFFRADQSECGMSTISARIPDKIYSLLRRRHRRVPAPSGTKVIFKNHNNMIDIMHVINISEGGMLICDNSSVNKYPLNSSVNEIFLTVPPKNQSDDSSSAHRVLPFIAKGRIVRLQQNQNSSISHYGISFQHENFNLSKRFNQVFCDFENHLR